VETLVTVSRCRFVSMSVYDGYMLSSHFFAILCIQVNSVKLMNSHCTSCCHSSASAWRYFD